MSTLPHAQRRPSPFVLPFPSLQHATPLLALLALAACGEGGDEGGEGGPTTPQPAAYTCGEAAVRLQPGESADLPAEPGGRVRCRIDAGTGAEFAVAYLDTRAARKAQTGPEGYGAAFPAYRVGVGTGADIRELPPTGAGVSAAAAAAPHMTHLRTQAAALPPAVAVTRETPWTVGERFALYDGLPREPRTARVLRVYDGRWAVAWFEGDNEALLPRVLAQLDSAWSLVGQNSLPMMRGVYSETPPQTSPGSGQYLLVLRAEGRGEAWGWSSAEWSFGSPRIWTEVKVREYPSALRLAELVSHELAHAYQAMYMYRTRPAGAAQSAAGATFWAVEGGADLVSFETVRRAGGIALTANLDARAAATPEARRLAQWAPPGAGVLTDGYAGAAGFLRLLAAQRAAGGEGEEQAVAEVLRGASEGWFGVDSYGSRRTGLAERMRARLGPAWNPEDALLDWALAHAADDRTANARFQDPTFLRVSELRGEFNPWRPAVTLSGPASGPFFAVPRGYGSPDYALLSGSGELVLAGASDTPGVRWKILRLR